MKAVSIMVVWGTVTAVGYGVARACGHFLSHEVNGIILGNFGFVAALCNAASYQVLRRFDDPPVKGMTPRGTSILENRIARRRPWFWLKWALAVSFGVVAGLIGSFFQKKVIPSHEGLIEIIGYITLIFSLTLCVLIAVEYSALSKLARDLPKRLEKEREKREMLEMLTGTDQEFPEQQHQIT